MKYTIGAVWLSAGLALALTACDDESTDSGTTISSGTGGVAGAGGTTSGTGGTTSGTGGVAGGGGEGGLPDTEGKITISASDLADANGKRLIASVLDQGTSDPLGAVCETIAGNPGSASGVVSVADGVDICDLGAEAVFQPGTYDVSAGIYAQGQAAPERCAAATVTVGGDVTVTLDSFSNCI